MAGWVTIFASDGWVRPAEGDMLGLTLEGMAAQRRLRELVGETRRLLTRGVSEQEYVQVVDVLRKMANNLEEG